MVQSVFLRMGFLMARTVPVLILLICLLAGGGCSALKLTIPVEASGGDWRMAGGDPGRTGYIRVSCPPPLDLRWSADLDGGIGSSAAVLADSIVFVATLHGDIQAFMARTGSEAGSRRLGTAIFGAPVVEDGNLYTTLSGDQNSILCYELRSGRIVWKAAMGETETAPVVLENSIVFCTLSGSVFSVSKKNGDVLWKYVPGPENHPAGIHSSPAAGEGTIVFGNDEGFLTALDASGGGKLWTFKARAGIIGSPVIAGHRVFAGSLDSTFYAIDASNGSLLWSRPLGSPLYSSPASGDGRVVAGTSDGRVVGLSAASGEVLWSFRTNAPVNAAPAVADTVLYIGSLDKTLYALGAVSGNLVWKYELEGRIRSAAAVSKYGVFVLSDDKKISAFVPSEHR